MKYVLGHLRRADEDFNMIQKSETIAVGVSGGKDSMALLHGLHLYRNFCRVPFDIVAVTVDLGFDGFDTSPIEAYCKTIGVKYTCIKTAISGIVFDHRKEKNPCALCSKMRKGALFGEIKARGITTCAFAHHRDDCLETLLLSMLYEGRMHTFKPKTYLDRKGITLIRPLVYLPESDIVTAVRRHHLPTVHNPCPASGRTKREEIKKLLAQICASNPDAKERMLTALKNTAQYSLWDKL